MEKAICLIFILVLDFVTCEYLLLFETIEEHKDKMMNNVETYQI